MEFIHAVQQALSPTAFWGQVWLAVTYLGSEYAFIVYLALAYWLLGPRVGRRLGFAVAVSFVLNDVLKNAVNGPRPFYDDPSVATPAAQATAGGGGFPSGHAQSAAAFWTLLTLEAGLGWLPVAVLVVAAVAVSRLA
ncbi:MAG TPA: phosphatase PAP2 family protein, partial [Deinococcales bacterium]|nr:phosphatase PAP2 family protein [Deinococcales bacterium]